VYAHLAVDRSEVPELRELLDCIHRSGLAEVVASCREEDTLRRAVRSWVKVEPHRALDHLLDHRAELGGPAVTQALHALGDTAEIRRRSALLRLVAPHPAAELRELAAHPTRAADACVHAVENADLATLTDLVTVHPHVLDDSAVGLLLRAVLLVAGGHVDAALEVLATERGALTDIQRRARIVNLTRLAEAPPSDLPLDRATVDRMIAALTAPELRS
jgi:hypothetical protein